jgi:hypothetical protein
MHRVAAGDANVNALKAREAGIADCSPCGVRHEAVRDG